MASTRAQLRNQIQHQKQSANQNPDNPMTESRIVNLNGQDHKCWVISLPADQVLLNPSSHRIKAQLESDPDWPALKAADPFSDEAQAKIATYIKAARTEEEYADLKRSLELEGQTDPGIMTEDGVLINANTRAVVMRDLAFTGKHYISVTLLPTGFADNPLELAAIEMQLQLKREHKVDYQFMNELLFIEDMGSTGGYSSADISERLGVKPADVDRRLAQLDLIRHAARLTQPPRPSAFFNRVSFEEMKEVQKTYDAECKKNGIGAGDVYLRTWLALVECGSSAVHNLRVVEGDFFPRYVLPALEDEDENSNEDFLARAFRGPQHTPHSASAGYDADLLGGAPGGASDLGVTDQIVDIVFSADNKIEIPGTHVALDRATMLETLKPAVSVSIRDAKNDRRLDNNIDAPAAKLRNAKKAVDAVVGAVIKASDAPEFETTKGKIAYEFKNLRKATQALEKELRDRGIGT